MWAGRGAGAVMARRAVVQRRAGALRGVARAASTATTVSLQLGGRPLTLEVGRLGPLTDGVVFARHGNTSLLLTAVSEWDLASSSDFVPFQVDYREKAFAGGVIPSTYTRREAAVSDRETLAARVIDRSCRPLFPAGYAYDTQVTCSVMSFDKDCDPAPLSITAAAAALAVSNIPWNGPVAAVRVGWVDGSPVVAPTWEQEAASKLSLLYSGTDDKCLMMEIGASELPERDVIRAMRFAHDEIQPLLALQRELQALAGKPKRDMPLAVPPPEVMEAVRELIWDDARHMYRQHQFKKAQRGNAQRLLFLKIKEQLAPRLPPQHHRYLSAAGDKVMKAALRSLVHEAAAGTPLTHVHPLRGPDTSPPTPHLPVGDAAVIAETVVATPASPPPIAPLEAVQATLTSAPAPVTEPSNEAAASAHVEPAEIQEAAAKEALPDGTEGATTPAPVEVAPASTPVDATTSDVSAAVTLDALAAATTSDASAAATPDTSAAATPVAAVVETASEPAPSAAPGGDGVPQASQPQTAVGEGAVAVDPVAAVASTLSPLQATAQSLSAAAEPPAVASTSVAAATVPAAKDDDVVDNAIEFELRDAAGARPDGRHSTAIRQLRAEVDVLPLVHGSAIFARGDTEVLCTATLGPLELAQMLRPVGGDVVKKHFFLHYDFPPYCTNEVGKVGAANRRMVGHGALAERALVAVMPDEAEFPYTVRATSEVSGSDGSSSMATVCGTCLALMDAGVPVRTPVAGISIGVFTPPDTEFRVGGPRRDYVLLTDIFGLEDHSGDMDFKVAGSRYGITAAQLDVKPAGLPLEVLEQALWRARDARLRVLDTMAAVLPRPRSEMKSTAPRIEQMMVPPELVGRLIGPGGSNVKRIMSATGARVQIDRDGDNPLISVYADPASLAAARGMIHSTLDEHRRITGSPLSLVSSPTAPVLTVGSHVTLRVVRVHEFGVVLGTQQHECGWMHISEFSPKRTTRVSDLLSLGDEVTALVVDVDSRGRAKFSIRMLLPVGQLDPSPYIKRAPQPPTTTDAATATTPPDSITPAPAVAAAVHSPAPPSTPAAPLASAAPHVAIPNSQSDSASARDPLPPAAETLEPVASLHPLTVTQWLNTGAAAAAAATTAPSDRNPSSNPFAAAAAASAALTTNGGGSSVYSYLLTGVGQYSGVFAQGPAALVAALIARRGRGGAKAIVRS